MTAPHEPSSLHEVVLGATDRRRGRTFAYAGVLAFTLHLGGAAAALTLGAADEPLPRRQSQPLIVFDHVVEFEPPAPPPVVEPPPVKREPPPRSKPKAEPVAEPAPVPEPVAETPPPPPDAPEPPPELPPSEPPPAAQAGQVVAQASDAPANPAAFQIATGAGSAYVGGTTSASGTGTKANHTGQVGHGNGNGLSRARPAQLRTRNWPCGWPPEAEELDIEETFVTIRAAVKADGALADVEVLSDPGYGFGRRAVWCARSKVKFEPALDAAGNPIAGNTPPLRVRFVRED